MPVFPVSDATSYADYRYFTADLLSNTILAEIPFRDVNYARAIKSAGAFSGKIAVSDENQSVLNLYESTLPGKTALYVVRNSVCVWGGIIWTRAYDLTSKELQVSASEFTSYFHHRLAWKTWTHTYEATVVSSSGSCIVTLIDGSDQLNVGSSVKFSFRAVGNFAYDGYYTVDSVSSTTSFTTTIAGLPTGTYPLTTVSVRSDTYDYARELLNSMKVDFSDLSFRNDEIEPALGIDTPITFKSLTSNIATLTLSAEHTGIIGQTVTISNVDSTFDGQYPITSVPTPTSLTYAKTNPNVINTATPVLTRSVTHKELLNYVATLTTSTSHGFSAGQIVEITNVDDGVATSEIFNGTFVITGTPTASTFTYTTVGVLDITLIAVSGTAVVSPIITIGTYGSFPSNSDLDIEYSTAAFSGNSIIPVQLRGFQLSNVGEKLDSYSDALTGFEYRVDCDYNAGLFKFTRTLVILPVLVPNPPAAGQISPLSRFGADRYIFEYPGNIDAFSIEESAEDAVTRMFVTGNIPDLGSDVSQPYAVATSTDLLNQGWPLLDAAESKQDVYEEDELYAYAKKFLAEALPPLAKMTLSVNGSMSPNVGTYEPGDWCGVIIDDTFFRARLQSPLELRTDVLVRKIESIKVSVPNTPSYPEKVDLELIPEWEVDKVGE